MLYTPLIKRKINNLIIVSYMGYHKIRYYYSSTLLTFDVSGNTIKTYKAMSVCFIINNVMISKRLMHRSSDTIVRTSYHLLEKILDSSTLNAMSKTDKRVFLDTLLSYSFNPNDGVIQHKASLLHQIFRDKYSSNIFKEHYLKRYPDSKVNFVKDILTDFRIFGELPVVRKYEETFSTDIKQVLLTGDSIATTFDKQKQTNPDIIVDLRSHFGVKRTYQDVKSGVIKHHTRGSLDMVTFDSNGEIIPYINKPFNLLKINTDRLNSIELGLKHDGLYDIFNTTINRGSDILKSEKYILTRHIEIRDLLWEEMQCHPLYNRSISFTFIEHQAPYIPTYKYNVYKSKFISILGDKPYDPNDLSHRKEIFNAMIQAYREVDPNVRNKFDHLKDMNVKIDQEFLNVISQLIKQTLI